MKLELRYLHSLNRVPSAFREFRPITCKVSRSQYSAQHVARITSYLALGAAVGPLLVQRLWPRTGTKFAVIASCLMMCTSVIALFVE